MSIKTKEEAINVIIRAAIEYKENLVHKNLLFVTTVDEKLSCFEVVFLPRNFLHLTGVKTNLSSTDFYKRALHRRLNVRQIDFTSDGTTSMKLDVLISLMGIHRTARMVGDYDNSKAMLVTDKLAGTITYAMGFRESDSLYIPNTALKADIRSFTLHPQRKVLVIFRKPSEQQKYAEITYLAKGESLSDLMQMPVLAEKVDCILLENDSFG